MAGSKVSNFAIGDLNIQSVMLTLDKTFKGQHQVSLTNYDTTAESQVAAGSVIEIGGALYKFDSNESITGTPSDGTVYIMAVPSGDSVTCAYTNTAPTWSDSKQGWYGTGATVNNRYIEYVVTKNTTNWLYKQSLNLFSKNRLNTSALVFANGTQLINTLGATIYKFTGVKSLYNSEYTVADRVKILERGVYSISFRMRASGSFGTAGTLSNSLYISQTTITSSGNMLLHKVNAVPPLAPLHGTFVIEAGNEVWIEYETTGASVPSFTVLEAFLSVRKIGE
jgi:hypothetical protein